MKTITLADASALTPSKIGDAFIQRVKVRTRAFIEQGKLVYALQQKNLRSGQSVQGILLAKGAPRGSIGNARKAAAVIENLVVTDLLAESDFDAKITWRVTRFANKVLGLDKGSSQVRTAEQVAAIITGADSAQAAADELECWNEHKCSLAEHEEKLKAAEQEAAKRAAEIAEDDAEFDAENPPAEEPTAENPTAQEPTAEEPTAQEPTADEPPAENSPVPFTPPATPEKPTAESVLESLMQVRLDASELDYDGLAAVLAEVNEFQQDLIDACKAIKNPAA